MRHILKMIINEHILMEFTRLRTAFTNNDIYVPYEPVTSACIDLYMFFDISLQYQMQPVYVYVYGTSLLAWSEQLLTQNCCSPGVASKADSVCG